MSSRDQTAIEVELFTADYADGSDRIATNDAVRRLPIFLNVGPSILSTHRLKSESLASLLQWKQVSPITLGVWTRLLIYQNGADADLIRIRRMSIAKLLYFPFWLAVALVVLGSFISFYPGVECGWYLIIAAFSLSGLFIPSVFYRVGTALLLLLALYAAYSGYRHGVEYRAWLKTHAVDR